MKKDTDFAQRWEWVCAQAAPTLLEAIEVFGDWESVRRNLIEVTGPGWPARGGVDGLSAQYWRQGGG